jgi:hypothetical protein
LACVSSCTPTDSKGPGKESVAGGWRGLREAF